MLHFDSDRAIKIREADRQIRDFDPLELRSRLCRCFDAVHREDSRYIADDLTLALEYSLLSMPNPEAVFDRVELELAVLRLLEDTGFPEVAAVFKQDGGLQLEEVKIAPEAIRELLLRHLACPPSGVQTVLDDVMMAARKLGIDAAPPQLLLELGRYYAVREQVYGCQNITLANADSRRIAETAPLLSEQMRDLVDRNIVRVNGLTALLPSIRFTVDIEALARSVGIVPVTTELELMPHIYALSETLAAERRRLQDALPVKAPCVLHIAELRNLVADYLSCTEPVDNERLAREIAGALGSALQPELFRCTFD